MPALAKASAALDGLDDYVERVLRDWQQPGLAIAVVFEDGHEYLAGYGYRELGGAKAVTPDTVFVIGSLTKAFTAAAIGLLVDGSFLGWDDPVRRHLEEFRLADPHISGYVTIRDLLAHRVGWEENYWRHFANRLGFTRQELVASLRFADPGRDFRARALYSNMMYVVAGEIVQARSGHSWDDFIRDRILTPLGMASSSTRAAALARSPNRATPHARDLGGQQRTDPILFEAWWTMDNHGAAGSINSTARDMARWLRAHCRPTGDLVSERTWREMHSPHILTGEDDGDRANVTLGYGLGWRVGQYHGRRYSYHEGAFRGMSAYAAVVPGIGSSVAVLANSRDAVKGRLTRAVGQWILDRLLGAPERDWQSEYRQGFLADLAAVAGVEAAWDSARAEDTSPSLSLPAYAGTYRHPAFVPWEVVADGDRLSMRHLRAGETYRGTLNHWHHDSFVAVWSDPIVDYWPARFVEFSVDRTGGVEALRFIREPGGAGTWFDKDG